MIEFKNWLLILALGALLYWIHPVLPLVGLIGAGVFFLTTHEPSEETDPGEASDGMTAG